MNTDKEKKEQKEVISNTVKLKKVQAELNRFNKIIATHKKTVNKLKQEEEVLLLRVENEKLIAKLNNKAL